MKIKYMLITGISILTLATSILYPRCNCPTWYKGFYTYKVYLTKPTNSPTDFYCILTKNRHGLYGGQPQDDMTMNRSPYFQRLIQQIT